MNQISEIHIISYDQFHILESYNYGKIGVIDIGFISKKAIKYLSEKIHLFTDVEYIVEEKMCGATYDPSLNESEFVKVFYKFDDLKDRGTLCISDKDMESVIKFKIKNSNTFANFSELSPKFRFVW